MSQQAAQPPVVEHLLPAELEAGLDVVRASPRDGGRVEMIVARPTVDSRAELESGRFTGQEGLVGDRWQPPDATGTADEPAVATEGQVTFINSRLVDLIARGRRERWSLAGDQLVVDHDLGHDNLRAGDRLEIGTATFEVTSRRHAGCSKFAARFGIEALKFVNSETGMQLRLRGMYARVLDDGEVRVGDTIRVHPA